MATVKDRVIALCKANNITVNKLQTDTGIGNVVSHWDKYNPRMDKLAAVATYFNVPVEALLYDDFMEQKENPTAINSSEELKNAERRGKYSHFIDLLDMSTQETQQEVLTLLISRLHSRVNQDEQK